MPATASPLWLVGLAGLVVAGSALALRAWFRVDRSTEHRLWSEGRAGSPGSAGELALKPGSPNLEGVSMNPRDRQIGRLRCERGLLATGVVLLGFWGITVLSTWAYQQRNLPALAGGMEAGRVGSTVVPPIVEPGEVVGQLTLSRLHLRSVIREGVDPVSLMLAVGHLPGTALPGGRGNAVFAGHRDTFFSPLRHACEDDTIRIVTLYGQFAYEIVSEEVVDPGRTDLLDSDRLQGVTLVTCFPFRYIGPAPRRFVITAKQIDPPGAPVRLDFAAGPARLEWWSGPSGKG
jgi:sortase A